MKVKVAIFSIAAATLATLMITAATYGLTDLVFAQRPPKFAINLTGREEVTPVQTNATGVGLLSAYDVSTDAVNATNIEGVTAGHTHLGKQGENGPVVVTFFKYDSPTNEVSETGSITADQLEGPMNGKRVSDLALAGANGTFQKPIEIRELIEKIELELLT